MKFLKAMMFALIALMVFTGCEKFTCNDSHAMSELAGTWTCVQPGLAEALVIKANGSVVSTGVENGEYWENVKGNISIQDGKISMIFEDDDNTEGHFDFIPGMAFSVTTEDGNRFIYNYCKEDLSDEIVGMWVCTDGPAVKENDMLIQTFNEDGSTVMTGDADELLVNDESTTYKVIGDLLFLQMNKESVSYVPFRITYSPDATTLGDVMTLTLADKNVGINSTATWLRINQHLDLEGQNYNYIKTFVSNVKGEDKDINFMGYTFNFATMDGSGLDKMLKALLFAVEFPDANTLTYSYQYNNGKEAFDAPIEVEGNKMTIKMSAKVPTLKDVVFYAFQDADCSQLHFYMHKTAFVNFYTNMQAMLLAGTNEQFDITNAEAVNAIYNEINNAVQTINVSLVMSK